MEGEVGIPILIAEQYGLQIGDTIDEVKVAAKKDKVLYIMDGNMQGEYYLGRYS